MITREFIEKREYEILSPLAARAAESRGREFPEEQCSYRTDYQRDRDRIIYSKAFRRLIHKTQVFIAPEDDHYRTRLTHTLEVAQVSRTVARILQYNEDLTEAIALGHDLGHTPFGHIAVYNGEQWVSDFKQKSIYPSGAYRTVGKYQIFRASDGWHWKHVWTTPVDWYGWIKSAIKGGNKIKY